MEDYYVITDLDDFVNATRRIIYTGFGKDNHQIEQDEFVQNLSHLSDLEEGELEKVLSHHESMIIVKEHIKAQVNKNTKERRYILTDTIFETIVNELNTRLVSNFLRLLVNKGLIESSFDEEANDFVFWVKDEK